MIRCRLIVRFHHPLKLQEQQQQSQSQFIRSLLFLSDNFTHGKWFPSYFSTINTNNNRNDETDEFDNIPSDIAKMNQTVDEWFTSIIKPASFYARHGDVRNRKPPDIVATATMTPAQKIIASQEHKQQRCYFYNIDLHGRLYLEENPIKNVTSSIKDMKFLDFFFASIKYVNETHKEYMNQHNIPTQDYPYVSICQNEWNFIRPAATPIVFHSLIDKEQYLLYGSNNTLLLREPFDETNGIVISKVSGMLYHKLTTHSYYPLSIRKRYPSLQTQQPQYALIRSTIALELSDRIVSLDDYYTSEINTTIDNINSKTSSTHVKEPIPDDDQNDPNHQNQHAVDIATTSSTAKDTHSLLHRPLIQHPPSESSSSGLGFITKYNRVVPIMYLPSYAEPGPYAMSWFE